MRWIILLLLAFPMNSWAALMEELGKPAFFLQENGVRVGVHDEVELRSGNSARTLYLSGAGLRKKRLGFANVSGYYALSYTDDPQGINVQDPLASVQGAQAKAVALVAVRLLTSFQIRNEIEDALIANQVDVSEPDVESILSRLTFNVPKGTRVVVGGLANGAMEDLFVEFPQQTLHSQGPGLAGRFWRGWFGTPVDDGMRKLKEALIGKSPAQWPFGESFLIAQPKIALEQ